MPRVTPSQAVAVIDQLFPHAVQNKQNVALMTIHANKLRGVVELTKAIPGELLVLEPAKYAVLVISVSAIKEQLKTWSSQGAVGAMVPGKDHYDSITLIRQVLSLCPDEYPPPTTTELLFVVDPAVRDSLRRDIGAVNRSLNNSEWKAATVLGGAALEALLHWRLGVSPPAWADITQAIAKLKAASRLTSNPPASIDDWTLHQFICVAGELGLIEPDTITAAGVAKNFRNLIHPGAAVRSGQVCDRATAYSAVAALEHVLRDLS
jgi:hypothetical protein